MRGGPGSHLCRHRYSAEEYLPGHIGCARSDYEERPPRRTSGLCPGFDPGDCRRLHLSKIRSKVSYTLRQQRFALWTSSSKRWCAQGVEPFWTSPFLRPSLKVVQDDVQQSFRVVRDGQAVQGIDCEQKNQVVQVIHRLLLAATMSIHSYSWNTGSFPEREGWHAPRT